MFANKIASLCYDHFAKLPKTGKPKPEEWTVLSCIVKEDTSLEVVALGTGTKCIGFRKMSPSGGILNDSHAEVVCRRAFLRYLYEQVGREGGVFDFDGEASKYALKPHIKFHFFTTHMPCGDAAIFPKQDVLEFGDCLPVNAGVKRKFNESESNSPQSKTVKLDNDIFRTGAKCLENDSKQDPCGQGGGYHVIGAIRTKPGRGDRTLSVSCSDKLAKWSHLGLQGALLSLLIKTPIYFTSITIAGDTPYCKSAFSRALHGRFREVDLKIQNFALRIPDVVQADGGFIYAKTPNKQPSPASIIWCNVKEKPLEIAIEGKKQGVTRKQINSKSARLGICKIELFRTFLNTVDEDDKLVEEDGGNLFKEMTYLEVKACARDYQAAWRTLRNDCFEAWTHKNPSLLQFHVD